MICIYYTDTNKKHICTNTLLYYSQIYIPFLLSILFLEIFFNLLLNRFIFVPCAVCDFYFHTVPQSHTSA